MNTTSEVLQKEFRVAQVIWVVILVALVIYAMVGNALQGKEFVDNETIPLQLIQNILWAVSGVMLVGSWFIRRKMLAAGDPGQPLGETEVAAKYRTATMIGSGLYEAIGLFGLVLVLLGDSLQSMYMFVLVASMGMLLHRPKMEDLEKLAGISGMAM